MIRTKNASTPLLALLTVVAAVPSLMISVSHVRSMRNGQLSSTPGYPIRFALPPASAPASLLTAEAISGTTGGVEDAIHLTTDQALQPSLGTAAQGASNAAALVANPNHDVGEQRFLLGVNYNLADPLAVAADASDAATLELAKRVRVDGVEVGQAKIRVSASGATVLVARDEIVGLLRAAGRADMAQVVTAGFSDSRFITFEELRTRGIDVRYDAAADRIALSS